MIKYHYWTERIRADYHYSDNTRRVLIFSSCIYITTDGSTIIFAIELTKSRRKSKERVCASPDRDYVL